MGYLFFTFIIIIAFVMLFSGGKMPDYNSTVESDFQRLDNLKNRVDSRINDLKNDRF